MNPREDSVLVKRLKSFLWRLLMLVGAASVEFLAENIGLFHLPPQAVVVAGLVLGELSKYLNTPAKSNLPG
jgi:hypothetical protein